MGVVESEDPSRGRILILRLRCIFKRQESFLADKIHEGTGSKGNNGEGRGSNENEPKRKKGKNVGGSGTTNRREKKKIKKGGRTATPGHRVRAK